MGVGASFICLVQSSFNASSTLAIPCAFMFCVCECACVCVRLPSSLRGTCSCVCDNDVVNESVYH